MNKLFLLLCALTLLAACETSNNKKDNIAAEQVELKPAASYVVGKYIYQDANSVAHISSDCWGITGLAFCDDDKSQNTSLRRILVDTVNRNDIDRTCSHCINDSIYELLIKDCHKAENLRRISNTLIQNGYTPPPFNEFVKDMEDEDNLRRVHQTLAKEGYNLPDFERFIKDINDEENIIIERK